MAQILTPYTLCQVTVHVKQELSIRLQKPIDAKIMKVKDLFSFKEAKLDEDGDFVADSGQLEKNSDVKIRTVILSPSQNTLSIDVLGGITNQAIACLVLLLSSLYDLSELDFVEGTEYIHYKTVVKAKLDNNIDGIFSKQMRGIIQNWRKFDTGLIVSKYSSSFMDNLHGMFTISEDSFDRAYKGQLDIFVLPTQIDFVVYIPSRYYRMTKHKISISVHSFEDYTDSVFFFTSDLPYNDHLKLITDIEGMKETPL